MGKFATSICQKYHRVNQKSFFVIVIIDNYDSFTYNLSDLFHQLNQKTIVLRNNCTIEEIQKYKPTRLVLSPGPGIPKTAGNLMTIIEHFIGQIPILGICLGHQALAYHLGAKIQRAKKPFHGKISKIHPNKDKIFTNINGSFNVVRYHSMIVESANNQFETLAKSEDTNEIMLIKNDIYQVYGFQFHPESCLTDNGITLLENWIKI